MEDTGAAAEAGTTISVEVACGTNAVSCDVAAELQLRGLGEALLNHQALVAADWCSSGQRFKSMLLKLDGMPPMTIDALCEDLSAEDVPIKDISPLKLIVEMEDPPPPPLLKVPLLLGGAALSLIHISEPTRPY